MVEPQCRACQHPERYEIDKCLLGGETVRQVAKQFGLSHCSVQRHKPHIERTIIERKRVRDAKKEAKHADTLLDRLEYWRAEAISGLNDAKKPVVLVGKNGEVREIPHGDLRARASFIGTGLRVDELYGQATGELTPDRVNSGPQSVAVNILLAIPRGEPGTNPAQVIDAVEVKAIEQGEDQPE